MTLELPAWFWDVPYDGSRGPGTVARSAIREGANCQLFAYGVLAHFGFTVPDFFSSGLWEDAVSTVTVEHPEPLDLVLFSKDQAAYGAHVGVVWGPDAVLHLCLEVGKPAVWSWQDFADRPRYAVRIGFKRPLP